MNADKTIRSLRLRGYTREQIAAQLGLPTCAVSHRIQLIWSKDQPRPAERWPDASEIAARCAAIQAEWSERERQRRQVGRGKRWTPAVVPASLLERARN